LGGYEGMLEEWKKRDPYLLDFDGFERLLAEREREERARLTVSLNHDYTYTILLELADVTFGKYMEENGISTYEQERILRLERQFVGGLQRIDFQNGATYVFRKKDGK